MVSRRVSWDTVGDKPFPLTDTVGTVARFTGAGPPAAPAARTLTAAIARDFMADGVSRYYRASKGGFNREAEARKRKGGAIVGGKQAQAQTNECKKLQLEGVR